MRMCLGSKPNEVFFKKVVIIFFTQNKYEFFCYMRYFVYLCIRIYNYTYIQQ